MKTKKEININNKIFDIVGTFIKKNPPIAILENIAINGNKIMATNLDTGIIYETNKEIGKIALDAKLLKGKTIDDIKIIDKNNHIAQIGNLTIKGDLLENFPIIPDVKQSPQLTVSSDDLINGLNKSIYAIEKGDHSNHAELRGIFIKNENNQLLIVASDTFRLSQIHLPANIFQDFEAIIPEDAAKQLLKTLKSVKPDKVSIAIDQERNVKFVFDNFTIFTIAIEGKFPNYKQVFPKKEKYQFEVNRKELLSALNQVPDKINEITIDLDSKNKQIILTSNSNDEIAFKCSVPVIPQTPIDINPNEKDIYLIMPIRNEKSMRENVIILNKNFLKDCLKNTNSDTIQFSFTDQNTPIVLTEE